MVNTKEIREEFDVFETCEESDHYMMGRFLFQLCDAYDEQQKEIERLKGALSMLANMPYKPPFPPETNLIECINVMMAIAREVLGEVEK